MLIPTVTAPPLAVAESKVTVIENWPFELTVVALFDSPVILPDCAVSVTELADIEAPG